jgi:hypothetical protein
VCAAASSARSLLDLVLIKELQLMIFLVVIVDGKCHLDESTYMPSSWLT